jgi:hypothetical protein
MSWDNPVCKGCGFEIIPVFDDNEPPPEYCFRCDPNYPRVKPSDLERLVSVPSAYRKLVELNIVPYFSACGDVEFLNAEFIFDARQHSEIVETTLHLQPFAQTGSGDVWCWTAFRTGPSGEPEILLIDDSSERVVVYAPNLQSFLYRTALEDASGRWRILPDELPPTIRAMAKLLRQVDAVALANDLDTLTDRPVKDYTPDRRRGHGLQFLGLLGEEEIQERLKQFLGDEFLDQEHNYAFLAKA